MQVCAKETKGEKKYRVKMKRMENEVIGCSINVLCNILLMYVVDQNGLWIKTLIMIMNDDEIQYECVEFNVDWGNWWSWLN